MQYNTIKGNRGGVRGGDGRVGPVSRYNPDPIREPIRAAGV